MKTPLIKIISPCLFLLVNFAFAQHEHNANIDNSMKQLFSTQQSEFTAEVQSVSEKLVTKKKVALYLKLSSRFSIDSSSITLIINSNNGKMQKTNNLMEYSSGLYNTTVHFQEPGSYQFVFSFNLKDSSENLKKANFSFTKDVEDADNMTKHDGGFMGMSNVMMIVMGAAMLAMMAIAIIVGTSHK